MNVLVIGGSGFIGSRIVSEGRARGHHIVAPSHRELDAAGSDEVTAAMRGQDAAISAYGSRELPGSLVDVTRNLLKSAGLSGVRLIAVGGAGTLEISRGLRLMDTETFPAAYLGQARAQACALDLYRESAGVEWTYISPAAEVFPGPRTGAYRTGNTVLLTDGGGSSGISVEDFAVAVIDEVESARHACKQFTVAY